ncbi:MAG: hypothetical protein FDW93_06385 [Bergeyella sp.]|nr:hypothetical protein [Bergeyella sp.]
MRRLLFLKEKLEKAYREGNISKKQYTECLLYIALKKIDEVNMKRLKKFDFTLDPEDPLGQIRYLFNFN